MPVLVEMLQAAPAVHSAGGDGEREPSREAGRLAARAAAAAAKAEGASQAATVAAVKAAYVRGARQAAAEAAGPATARGLVVAPTRELAQQTAEAATAVLEAAGLAERMPCACVVGGSDPVAQGRRLRMQRPSLVVGTPGRLLTLCGGTPSSTRSKGESADAVALEPAIDVGGVCAVVFDEADRLLELGFEEDVMALAARCKAGLGAGGPWVLFGSATWGERTMRCTTATSSP